MDILVLYALSLALLFFWRREFFSHSKTSDLVLQVFFLYFSNMWKHHGKLLNPSVYLIWFHVSENYTPIPYHSIPYHLWHIILRIFHKKSTIQAYTGTYTSPLDPMGCPKAILKDDFPFPQLGKVSSLDFVLSATFLLTFLCRKSEVRFPTFGFLPQHVLDVSSIELLGFVSILFGDIFDPIGLKQQNRKQLLLIWSNYSDLTRVFTPNGGFLDGKSPKNFREIWGQVKYYSIWPEIDPRRWWA